MPGERDGPSAKHTSWRGDWDAHPSAASSALIPWFLALVCLTLAALLVWLLLWPALAHKRTTHFLSMTGGGIDNQAGGVPPLLFAEDDARRLADVDVVIRHESRVLTSDKIDSVDEWLQLPPHAEDVLLVYVSAQGVSHVGKDATTTPYLLCADFVLLDSDRNGRVPLQAIAVDDLLKTLCRRQAAAKLLILDMGTVITDPRMGIVVNQFPSLLKDSVEKTGDPKLWVLTSHRLGQIAHRIYPLGNSLFGWSVMDRLRGRGDTDGDVTLGELYRDVVAECERISGGQQIPELLWGSGATSRPSEESRDVVLVGGLPQTAAEETEADASPSQAFRANVAPIPAGLRDLLRQAWQLRDDLEDDSEELDRGFWEPIEYAPYLWRHLNARLLDLEFRASGGVAIDKEQVQESVADYIKGLQSLREIQQVSVKPVLLQQLMRVAVDFHSAAGSPSRESFDLPSPEFDSVTKTVRTYYRVAYRAVDYVRWNGQQKALAANTISTDRWEGAITSLLESLIAFRKTLDRLDGQSANAELVGDLQTQGQQLADWRTELDALLDADVRSAIRAIDEPSGRLHAQLLLGSPLITAAQRDALRSALEDSVPKTVALHPESLPLRPGGVPLFRPPDPTLWREQLELESLLQTFLDHTEERETPTPLQQYLAAAKKATWDSTQEFLEMQKVATWLGEYYARLPDEIAVACEQKPARAERLVRLLDARDAMDVDQRVRSTAGLFPTLRFQAPKATGPWIVDWIPTPDRWIPSTSGAAPTLRLTTTPQTIVLQIESPGELPKSVQLQVAGVNPNELSIRGQDRRRELSSRPVELPVEPGGLVTLQIQAEKTAESVRPDGVLQFTLQASGQPSKTLPLNIRLPRPNQVSLLARCLVPNRPAMTRGADGLLLQPYPNRTTSFELQLANLSDEDKTVDVELWSVRRPEDARYGVGRLLDNRGEIPLLDFDTAARGALLANAKSLALPSNSPPRVIIFDTPSAATPASTEQNVPTDSSATEATDSAAAPPEFDVTDGMVCIIRNTEKPTDPAEHWVKWVEIKPLAPSVYLDMSSRYSADEGKIVIALRRKDDANDQRLPENLAGETSIEVVLEQRDKLLTEARGDPSVTIPQDTQTGQIVLEGIPPQTGDRMIQLPITIDGYPRAFVQRLNLSGTGGGVNSPRQIRIAALSMEDRVYTTASGSSLPGLQVEPRTLPEDQAAAFAVPVVGEGEPITVFLEIDTFADDAFSDPRREDYDEIRVGWEGAPTKLYSDRQVEIKFTDFLPGEGRFTLRSTVQDCVVSLPTGRYRGPKKIFADGRIDGKVIPPDQIDVLLDHLPPRVEDFRILEETVPKGKPIRVLLTTTDWSGLAQVKAGLTDARDGKLPPDTPLLSEVGRRVGDRNELRFSLATDDDKISAGSSYWVQFEATDQVGHSVKTDVNNVAPVRVIITAPREMERREAAPPVVTGTLTGFVIFGEVGFGTRPANFPVQIRGNGISKRAITQAAGVFRFLDIPAGEYVLSASGTLPLGGSKKGEIQVKLEKQEDYNQEFVIPIE